LAFLGWSGKSPSLSFGFSQLEWKFALAQLRLFSAGKFALAQLRLFSAGKFALAQLRLFSAGVEIRPRSASAFLS